MPIREFECGNCEYSFEFFQRTNENPKICPACEESGHLRKMVSACAFKSRDNRGESRARDEVTKGVEQRQDLKENHGIEGFSPVGKSSVQDVYDDVKSQGSFVKDKMQETQENNQKANKKKRRKWMEGALKRSPKRRVEMGEKRAAEAAAKRKITLTRRSAEI